MRWPTLIAAAGLIGIGGTATAQQATQLPVTNIPVQIEPIPAQLPTLPENATKADVLKALMELRGIKHKIERVQAGAKIRAYVDAENAKQNDAIQDYISNEEEQDKQDWARQVIVDKIQDNARESIRQWVLEKWLEDRLRGQIATIQPIPQPVIQQPAYTPPMQYAPPVTAAPAPYSSNRGFCRPRSAGLRLGVTARKRFLGGVVLKPTLSLE